MPDEIQEKKPELSAPQSRQTAKEMGWQALKFTLFSASAGVIQLGLGEILLKVFHLPYEISYAISLVASVLWNFTFNRRYTFRSDMNVPRAMLLVALYYAVFLPLSTWWGGALTRAGWNEDLVFVGTMLVNFVTEYAFQRFVVYRKSMDTNAVAKRAKG